MTAASGADQPTLRDQLAKWIHDRTRKRSGDAWGWYSNELTETAGELLSLIEPHVERAKAEAAAEARRGHSHTRWRNGDGPWQPDPCPADCPATTPPP